MYGRHKTLHNVEEGKCGMVIIRENNIQELNLFLVVIIDACTCALLLGAGQRD